MANASAPPTQWQEVPVDLLEAIFIILPPRDLRRARLVCQRWCLLATPQAVSAKVQPHVLDMQHEPLLWTQQLGAGAKMLPNLESMQMHLSSRVPEAVADAHLAQLSVFTNLKELKLAHIIGNPSWAESYNTRCSYRPYFGPAWPLPLEGLQRLRYLQRLTLHTTNLPSPRQLAALGPLACLTHLAMQPHNIDESFITEEHLEVLAALSQLRSVDLHINGDEEMSGEETEAMYQMSTLVQLQALKVTLHGECQSATGLLDVLLPPLRRLTLLELGPLLDTPGGLARDLYRYVDGLPAWALQQPAGAPGRPFLRLLLSVCEGEEGEGDDDLQPVLDALAPQVAGLSLHCTFKQGTSPAVLEALAHPAVDECSCMLLTTYSREPGTMLPVPVDCIAIAAKLALLPTTSSLILHPSLTDNQLLSLASMCSHLTHLKASYSSAGCPLAGAVCQNSAVLSSLRKLNLTGGSPLPFGAAAGQPGSSTSRHLTLRLGILPPQLRSFKLHRAELDTTASDTVGGASIAEALQEVMLTECLLTGGGIHGLLQLTPALKLLHMSEVRFNSAHQHEAAELLAADSLTSLTVNKCEYEGADALEGAAALRGYEWMCALANLRHLEWSYSLRMWQQLPEVLPHLPKLHSVQVVDVNCYQAGDLMLRDLPLADFVKPKPHRSIFNPVYCW